MVLIGHASIDENGKSSGGLAGDQTKKEVCIRSWYNKGWNKLIRAKDSAVAEKLAKSMEDACANDNIGYDQKQRTTLFACAKEKNFDIPKITTKCECDCSSLVAVCVNAAGISVSKDIYTGNQANALKNTGKFDVLTESKYLTSDINLMRGDILLREGSHTAIVLSNGVSPSGNTSLEKAPSVPKIESAQSRDSKLSGTYVVKSNLNLRVGAGSGKTLLLTMPKGTKVQNYGYYTSINGIKWLYVTCTIKGTQYNGFCSVEYLTK